MSTWTCKGPVLALACLLVAGCDGLPVAPSGDGQSAPALREARMGAGSGLTVMAPDGFCIDPRSMKSRFVLMARCDTLGVEGASADAPLALITATAIPARGTGLLSLDDLGAGGETVLSRVERDDISLVQVDGTPPDPSLRSRYWRAATRVGNQVLGVAIYQSRDLDELGNRAPDILVQTLQRTRDRSGAGNSATTGANPARRGPFVALFE